MTTAQEMAGRLGLRRSGHSWRGDCPACGYRGALAIKETRSGRSIAFCSNGCDREGLAATLEGIAGGSLVPTTARQAAEPKRDRADAARRLWTVSLGLDRSAAGPAIAYLRSRGIAHLARSPALRFHLDVHHPEGGSLAALVALVTDSAGAPIAAHRTYLKADGSAKASVTPAKASLGPVWGGAVRLEAAPGGVVVIGEGIESSASAGLLLGLPAWAAISAGNLAQGLLLPSEIREVVIAADPDPPGLKAAEAAMTRWQAEGRVCRILVPLVDGDFNDQLRMQGAA